MQAAIAKEWNELKSDAKFVWGLTRPYRRQKALHERAVARQVPAALSMFRFRSRYKAGRANKFHRVRRLIAPVGIRRRSMGRRRTRAAYRIQRTYRRYKRRSFAGAKRRRTGAPFARTRATGAAQWNPITRVHRHRAGRGSRPVRLNGVIPDRRRVWLTHCFTTDCVTLAATDAPTTEHRGLFAMLAPDKAGQGSAANWRMGTAQCHSSSGAQGDQPHGHDLMYSMYGKAMCMGVKYELDILHAAGAVIVGAFGGFASADVHTVNPDKVLCPPFERHTSGMRYRKTRVLASNLQGDSTHKMRRNALSGYISAALCLGKTDHFRLAQGADHVDKYQETSTTLPSTYCHFNIGLSNMLPGTQTFTVVFVLRLYWDMLFFEKVAIADL